MSQRKEKSNFRFRI